MGPKKVADPKK